MVNTRVLEQRLGWRRATPEDEPEPPVRPISHAPVLQGRIQQNAPNPRGPRRLAIEEAWDALAKVDGDPADLAARARMVPAFTRGTVAGAALDQLRTQLMRALKENGWGRIGITSPRRGAGRSFLAAGLATSIARLDAVRVLLIDGDLEAPGQAELFGVEAPEGMEEVLSGSGAPVDTVVRLGADLAVAMNDAPIAFGSDLLQSPDAILAIRALRDTLAPDVMIVDMPPLLDDAVAQSWLPQLDAVLLLADGTGSTAGDITECERLLEEQVTILGIAMNKTEDSDPRPPARRRR